MDEPLPQPPDMQLPEQHQSDGRWFQSEMWQALEKIIDDPVATHELKDFAIWIANSPSMKLTFFNDSDAAVIEHWFEACVCRFLRRLPSELHTYTTYSQIDQLRMLLYANLRRSIGAPIGKLNERTAIIGQMQLNMPITPQKPPGLVRRLIG